MNLDMLAGRGLVIATALNLNGAFNMIFNVGQAVSILMLALSIFLIIRLGKAAWSTHLLLFILSITSYIIFGYIFSSPINRVETSYIYASIYFGTILITWAASASYLSAARSGKAYEFLGFCRNTFIVTAAGVWASPFLYTFYINAPPSMADRMSGFFGNPNEAGAASAAGLALVLGLPYRQKILTIAGITVCFGAIVLTFSKTAIILGIFIVALAVLQRLRGLARLISVFTAIILIHFVQQPRSLFDALAAQSLVELSGEQQRRIAQMGDVLAGDLTVENTTGRTDMWSLGLERIMTNFPAGQGLGSYHFLEGGYYENGVLQGVHNTFLMLTGEAGLPALILFLAFCSLTLSDLLRNRELRFALFLALVLFSVLISGHNTLSLRFIDLIIGIIIGALLVARRTTLARRM